jgi:hypothetical protein
MTGRIRDIVFFIGSGFSACIGWPTMTRFGKTSKDELANVQKQELARRQHKGADYVKAGEFFFTLNRKMNYSAT